MNNDIALGLAWYVVFVLSLSFHEAAHAFAAMKLGDKTAYYGGQVSLHPFAHIRREPIGMIVLPIISYILNGWMIGWASAPYDRAWAQRHPKREIMMAMAGPAANLNSCHLGYGNNSGGLFNGILFSAGERHIFAYS